MSNPTRRAVLTGAAATLLPLPGLAGLPQALRAAPGQFQLLPKTAPATAVWAYEGEIPGPEIRVKQGSPVTRRFVNDLPQGSSVHWHGIRLPNAMDGVAGVTQPAVETGGEFLYDFVAPDAGTYWYHPHNRTYEQMARGLYGPLIVEEAEPPEVDDEIVLMLDDWRLTRTGAIDENFGHMHDRSHAGRIGNWVTVNAVSEFKKRLGRNSRLRLRLVNAANARIFVVGLQGMTGWTVALDGMPLEQPVSTDRLTLAPSQRADLIVDLTDEKEGLLYSVERDGTFALASFPVDDSVRAAALGPPIALPANDVPAPGPLASARLIDLPMDGGAMGRMRSARLNGEERPIRDLVDAGMAWSLAGTAGMPADPLAEISRGETVRIAISNNTGWPHAMHLHGHHFREARPGQPLGPLRDTLLFQRDEEKEIVFVADNPGDWLLHCHMLEHAAAGMMTWLRVL